MQTHVRVHVPERGLATWLLLDVGPSMTFGTADRRKADVAEGVALAFGHLATRRANRLGVLTFGGPTEQRLPLTTDRGHVVGLLERLREADATTRQRTNGPTVGATSPAAALQFIARTARPGGFIVVVSDFRGLRDWRTSVIAAAARHEVLAVEIRDPREERLPAMGELTLIDPETGRQIALT